MKTQLHAAMLALALATTPLAVHAAEPPAAEVDAMLAIDTPTFVKIVSSSNAFEIESSKLAEQKSALPDVKEFATQMIADHTKAGEDLKAALAGSGAAEPPTTALAPKHAAMLKLLQDADAASFDMLYIDMQAGAHMEAVSLFQTFAKGGDNDAVKAFATATLPTLQMHKEHVKDLVGRH